MVFALALAGVAAAYNATTTVEVTNHVTIPCPSPTTLTYGSSTYTITKATTLTVEDCSCTHNAQVPTLAPVAPGTSAPVLANGANAVKAGAAAGVAAAVAYML